MRSYFRRLRTGKCRLIIGVSIVFLVSACGPVNRWQRTDGPESDAGPAIAAHSDGRIYVAATTDQGEIEHATSRSPGNWSAWQSIGDSPPGGFATDTAPVLLAADPSLLAYARGADNNLYRSGKVGSGAWSDWAAIISDGTVHGRFSIALTNGGSSSALREDHVTYVSDGGCQYRQVLSSGVGQPREWPGCLEAVTVSDGLAEVGIALRFDDQIEFEVADRPSGWNFRTFLPLSRVSFALSNLEYFEGDYHLVFANRQLTDDVSQSYRFRLLHTWFDGASGRAQMREVAEYRPTEEAHAVPALTLYRNKLLASWTLPSGDVHSARWDNADPQLLWIAYGSTGAGEGRHSPALLSFDRRSFIPSQLHGEPNYGNDAYATIAGNRGDGAPEFIVLSRALMRNDISRELTLYNSRSDTLDPVFREPSEPFGPERIFGIWDEDRIILSEIGFNLWALPDWLVGNIYSDFTVWMCTDDDGVWQDDQTPCDTSRLPVYIKDVGGIFNCGGAWINRDNDYIRVWEEMGHYFAPALGFGTTLATNQAAADRSGIALSVLEQGRALFSEATQTCNGASPRCPGFTGIGGNYDAGGVEHSFMYTVYFYLSRGDEIRQFIAEDLTSGNDLLQRKYDWVKTNIFRGIEYRDNLVPL